VAEALLAVDRKTVRQIIPLLYGADADANRRWPMRAGETIRRRKAHNDRGWRSAYLSIRPLRRHL